MHRYLVIVESPAKANTIQKYLGKNYKVMASYGHVRNLAPKKGAVDTENNFKAYYQEIERNQRHVLAIQKALKTSHGLLLAPDPDREGEAIAWHIKEILSQRGVLKEKEVGRVVFHEITRRAVQEAINNPRCISIDLVNAQQARRILDYLVGFTLSPLLWKKIRAGLSAGRVQSPALRMIVEREKAIDDFIVQEYWSIHAKLQVNDVEFFARLIKYKSEKVEQFTVQNEKQAQEITDTIEKLACGKLTVIDVRQRERKRQPSVPFITSTLQQEASRKLGFSTQRTMQVAQQLYEGIDIGEGSVGLITYMRTDSVTLAQEALIGIREHIKEKYGQSLLPLKPRIYKTKTKNAQEAHEAIRPTSFDKSPADIKRKLSSEQYKLYNLIWKRTIASQMIDATLSMVAVDLAVEDTVFRANGSMLINPGFIKVYQVAEDNKQSEDQDRKMLPPLKEGESIEVMKFLSEQHFTEPPPRYTEASLVKMLEEYGIGRPSTYASIISTLKNRQYVVLENRRFQPTDVGIVVNRFLTGYFTKYVDYHFTANLEDDLDAISRGDKPWIPLLKAFWEPFKELVDNTEENVKRSEVTQEKTDEKCPDCGEQLSICLGKSGRFIGCNAYPNCGYTRSLNKNDNTSEVEIVENRHCPHCRSALIIKQGRYGKFIGCSHYPDCRYIEPLKKPKDTGVLCPKCKKGNLYERQSRKGKTFFSCQCYPDCRYALWGQPILEACPQCHWPILSIKTTKRQGAIKSCPQKECDFSKIYPIGDVNDG